MHRMTYQDLIDKYGTPTAIAHALGFIKPRMSKRKAAGQVSRVSNWGRTGIPARQLKRIGDIVK